MELNKTQNQIKEFQKYNSAINTLAVVAITLPTEFPELVSPPSISFNAFFFCINYFNCNRKTGQDLRNSSHFRESIAPTRNNVISFQCSAVPDSNNLCGPIRQTQN